MFAGRLSAALGPLLFGAISAATGSQRLAILSILGFIFAGAVVLATVRQPRNDDLSGGRKPTSNVS
jgi:MFS-type transporter involved in bile tolerance (Atg22 family)